MLALIVAVSLAGCGDRVKDTVGCSSDSDCEQGSVCHHESGKCLANVQMAPDLEVWPPSTNNQGWVSQEFLKPTFGLDGKLNLQLKASVSMQGRVYSSDKPGVTVPASIVAWRTSLIKGRPKVQVGTATSSDTKSDLPKAPYVLWLARDLDYTFFVAPKKPYNTLYPPLVVNKIRLTDHIQRDLVLEGLDRTVAVKGKILDAAGSPLPDQKVLGVKGRALNASLRVWASEMDGFYQSTPGLSDAKSGEFLFRVPASVTVPATGRVYTLTVESMPGSIPVPTVSCPNIVLGLFTGQKAEQDLGKLKLPAFLMPRTYTWFVKGSDKKTPVVGATVKFYLKFDKLPRSQGFDKCTAFYQQTAITDSSGKVTVLLLPGNSKNLRYQVTITSPANSRYASQLIKEMEVGATGGVHKDIVLDDRYELKGKVVGPDGKPVVGAVIEAEGIRSVSPDATVQPATTSTTSDDQGIFSLFADSGNYNLNVRPPQGVALPGFVMRNKKIDGNLADLLFKIPRGTILSGTVKQPSGKPLGSAKVEVYEQVYDSAKTLTAIQRASDISTSDGSFTLVLPAKN